jgi:hypothetical protein
VIFCMSRVRRVLFKAAHSLRSGARSLAEPDPVANNWSSVLTYSGILNDRRPGGPEGQFVPTWPLAPKSQIRTVRRPVERTIESMMEEQLGGGLDCASRQMRVCHSIMFYVCLTKKILIRGLVSPRDHTS